MFTKELLSDPTVADKKTPPIESSGVSASFPTPVAEVAKESEMESWQKKNRSEALKKYFEKFGSVEVFSSSKLLEKENARGFNDKKIFALLTEDLESITEQYQELLEILSEDERDLLPRFGEKPWSDRLRDKILAQSFFAENDIVAFTVRAENLSDIARQIKGAQKILLTRIAALAAAETVPTKQEAA